MFKKHLLCLGLAAVMATASAYPASVLRQRTRILLKARQYLSEPDKTENGDAFWHPRKRVCNA